MKLRPYQEQAKSAVAAAFAAGAKSTLVVLPTGCGKTVVFSTIAAEQPGRVLIIAHRQELINQAASKILGVTGHEAEIEMADQRADAHMFRRSKVIVASKDTLRGRRLDRFDPREFSMVITDEAHHAVAESYGNIYEKFAGVPHLGVTATPDRHDETALGKIFDSVAFVYELPDAIRDGWLCPITQRTIRVNTIDYSKCRTTGGDLNGRDLADVMNNEEILQTVADVTIRESKWRKALVFAPPGYKTEGQDRCRTSERLTEIFNRHRPDSARMVSGETPADERKQTLADYAEGRFQYLINVGVFTEGFDDPTIDMVVMARATKSRALYSQMVGRGTRTLPGVVDGLATAEERRAAIAASAKPTCEVLDFEGNAGQHKLMHTADILGGNYSEEEVEKAEKLAKKAGEACDMTEKLEEARKLLEAEREAERNKRRAVVGVAQYSSEIVDPFNVLDIAPVRFRGWDAREPASEKQIGLLKKFAVPIKDGMTKREASAVIGAVFARREAGLCNYKQAEIMAKHGLPTANVSYEAAKAIIDGMARKARVMA